MKNKKMFTAILMFILFFSITTICFANSAQLPSIFIIVNNPPEDLSVSLVYEDREKKAYIREVLWEKYYYFDSSDMYNEDAFSIKITTGGETIE